MYQSEEIETVISGIGGHFPESNNLEQLKKNLFDEVDMVSLDSRRWDPESHRHLPQATGKISDPTRFDTTFFNISPKICSYMDRTNRLLLERAFEAIYDSGNNPFSFKGRNIAVYTSCSVAEQEPYDSFLLTGNTGYSVMGVSRNMYANRVSYFLHLIGPSCCYGTSFTGGVELLIAAAEQINQGLIEAAVVGIGSVHVVPTITGEFIGLGTDKSQYLCTDGKSRSFDAEASGCTRSEAVVCFFLQRKSDAKRNYGTVLHSNMSVFGDRQCAFIDLEEKLVTDFLRQFYEECGIDPSTIAYLEADGCAIKRTDIKELNSLSKVFCCERTSPLLIGSVKSNLGHTEGSSSLVGICKAVIAMEAGMIPPNLHYNTPNPEVPALINEQLKVVTRSERLTGDLVAVNNVSFNGAVGHVLLRQNPKPKKTLTKESHPEDDLPRLILTSSRHLPGINQVNDLIKTIPFDPEFVALVNNIHKENIQGHMCRSYSILPGINDVVEQEIKESDNLKPKIWFVFSGMGSQWNGMGREIMKLPTVAASIEKCHKILEPLGVDLKHVLVDMNSNVFNNILHCFVGIAAVQIALVDLLKNLGVVPDGIIGHSVGELGCAYADGCFTAEEMILSAYARGKASLGAPLIRGMMAAVGLGYNQIKDRLPETIEVACHNSGTSCTLSGPADDVNSFVEQLKNENIFAATVNVGNIAFHSRYIAPAAPALLESLKQVIKVSKPRSPKWISSSVPEANWSAPIAQLNSPEYHTNNLLSFVLFEEACRHIPEGALCIEISPHGLLQSIMRRALPVVNVPLTNRSSSCNLRFLLKAIGILYLNNVSVDVNAIYPDIDYPVSRGTPGIAQLLTWDHAEKWNDVNTFALDNLRKSCIMETDMKSHLEVNRNILGHKINSNIVDPITDLLILVWSTYSKKKGNTSAVSVVFEDIFILEQIILSEFDEFQLVWTVPFYTGNFEVFIQEGDKHVLIMKGKISFLETEKENHKPAATEEFIGDCKITQQEFYDFLQTRGYQLTNYLMAVKEINLSENECRGQVLWENDWLPFLDSIFKVNEFFAMEKSEEIVMTSYIKKLKIDITNFTPENIGILPFFGDSKTKSLHCNGLEIAGAEFKKFEIFNPQSKLFVEKLNFVPILDNYSQINQFLSTTLQFIREASLSTWKSKIMNLVIYEISDSDKSTEYLSQQLEEVINNQENVEVQKRWVSMGEFKTLFSQKPTSPILILLNSKQLKECATSISCDDSVFFLGVFSGELCLTDNTMIPILQHKSFNIHETFHHYTVTLFKKAEEVNKMNVIQIIKGPNWLNNLRDQVIKIENTEHIVIFWNHKPESGIIETCKILTKEDYAYKLRCFFIMDENAPVFSLRNTFYARQVSLGLAINVFIAGEWGSIERNLISEVQESSTPKRELTDMSIHGLDIYCLGLNPDKSPESQESLPQIQFKHTEYSGMTEDGERVMGLAMFDQFKMKINPDSILNWTVPPGWNLEEAASVPLAYVTAYFGLSLIARLVKRESVLVNAGHSPMGEAVIAVALQLGANVYTTVANDQQAAALIKRFPKLNRSHILYYERHFDVELLMQTKGEGVRVVLNNMSGEVFHRSLNCLAIHGKFIQLAKADMEKKEKIGMVIFLKNTAFYGMATDNIFNTTEDWKQKLQFMVQDGIKRGVVKPLPKKVFSSTQSDSIINFLDDDTQQERVVLNLKKTSPKTFIKKNSFKCDSLHSYLIVERRTEFWVDLAEWLLTQGARTIMVATSNRSSKNLISHRINALVTKYGATIIETSADRTNTVHSAIELVEEANRVRPLAAVISLFMEANSKQVKHLDIASRKVVPELPHFVCLLGGDSDVCNERRQAGLPALVIQSDSTLTRPRDILKYLKQLMDHQDTSPGPQLILVNDSVINEMDSSWNTVYLPSFEELCDLGTFQYKRPHIEEVTTLSPRFHHLPKCASARVVFIFPGVSAARIDPLVKKLYYPSYLVTPTTEYHSIEELAAEVVEEILNVNNAGPYTLLSETWSGALAVEVGRKLEAHDLKVTLFLLDASPSVIQGWARMIGQANTAAFDENLLSVLLKLNMKNKFEITKASNWEERLEYALKSERERKQYLINSLTSFRSMFIALLNFKPSDDLLEGKVYFLQQKGADSVDLVSYFKAVTVYTVADASTHSELITSNLTAQIINENSNCSWY